MITIVCLFAATEYTAVSRREVRRARKVREQLEQVLKEEVYRLLEGKWERNKETNCEKAQKKKELWKEGSKEGRKIKKSLGC